MTAIATNSSQPITMSRDQLYELVWKRPIATLARDFGVSPNALTKICDRMLVPYPGRGYWSKAAARRSTQHPLPHAPSSEFRAVTLGNGRHTTLSRRPRSRMSPADRIAQILAIARETAIQHGIAAVNLKRVARVAGISETLIYHYFSGRLEIFIALARQELDAVREGQKLGLESRDGDLQRGIDMTTRNYLVVMAERGDLVQTLLSDPVIAARFQMEYKLDRETIVRTLASAAVRQGGVPESVAVAASQIITAVTMRAGRLLVKKKMPVDTAVALSLAAANTGAKAVVKFYGAPTTRPLSVDANA
jgi:AcrR family transcriptional regulator